MSVPVRAAAFIFPKRPSSETLTLPLRNYYTNETMLIKAAQFSCSTSKSNRDESSLHRRRRSADFQPNLWDYNYVQSLDVEYAKKKYVEDVEMMKVDVRTLINAEVINDPMAQLELIDAVQRLGLEYHFEQVIKDALGKIHATLNGDAGFHDDLYATALRFRLLRQHGYSVPQDVFDKFMDDGNGKFYESLSKDVKGVLSLYEASFHRFIDESVIDEAKAFSTACLKKINNVDREAIPPSLVRKVDRALDMPIRWRPSRLEARWFMDEYKQEPKMNNTLLRLAKLDYNISQATYKREAAELTRWWQGSGLANVTFFRDRVMENFLWNTLMVFEPQYEAFRVLATRITILITVIDDVYDVYGTLDELELLTELINRWDTKGAEKLPPTIRTCFLALYNEVNELGNWAMKKRGSNDINGTAYLHKVWADQCKGYLVEAKWFHKGLKPRFEEYINHAVTTVGSYIMLMCCILTTSDKLTQETLDYLAEVPTISRCCAMMVRLTNDLATSVHELARGDNLKAMECYMNESETGVTEEVCREHMKNMMCETWKIMNKDQHVERRRFDSGPFVSACLNLSRASHFFYQYGDGHGIPDRETKENLMELLVQPVPLDE